MIALAKTKPITTQEVLRTAVLSLQQAKIESASLDARILLQHVLRLSREQFLLAMEESLSNDQHAMFNELIAKRTNRQPVAQIIGKREFWGMEFKVTGDTLDPRPDSESVIEAVLGQCRDRLKPYKVLDLGTGTGCLLLSLLNELPNATGIGVDISEAALAVAKENTIYFGMQSRVAFLASNWCEKLAGQFDIIVANPPYIPSKTIESLAPEVANYEPRLALDGGEDGLDCYRDIMHSLPLILEKDGIAVFEIGIGQQAALAEIATSCAMKVKETRQDLGGIIRCVIITH